MTVALTGPSSSCSVACLCSFCLQSVQNLKADLSDGLFLAGKFVGIFKGKYYLLIGLTANQNNLVSDQLKQEFNLPVLA